MMARYLYRAVLATTLTLGGCSSNQAAATPPSPIVGTWQQTKAEERVGTGAWAVPADGACRLDNTEEYGADGAFTLYDGTLRCGAAGSGISKGTWRLAAANTKLIFTYDGASGEYPSTVETLTDTDLMVTYDTGDTAGTQTRNTYRKQ